jgi:hypothetical protein
MMPDIDVLARQIIRAVENHSRYVVPVAGPPGAGTSLRGQCSAMPLVSARRVTPG